MAVSISASDRMRITVGREMDKSRAICELEAPLTCLATTAPLTTSDFDDLPLAGFFIGEIKKRPKFAGREELRLSFEL